MPLAPPHHRGSKSSPSSHSSSLQFITLCSSWGTPAHKALLPDVLSRGVKGREACVRGKLRRAEPPELLMKLCYKPAQPLREDHVLCSPGETWNSGKSDMFQESLVSGFKNKACWCSFHHVCLVQSCNTMTFTVGQG